MRMIFSSTITGRNEEYDSQLTLQNPGKPSIIKYTIPLTFMEDEFQILATDYESFAIEYKCDPNGLLEKSESIWLLTREKNPSPLILQRAYAIMHRLGVDIRKLERVDQTCGGLDIADYPDYDYFSANPQVIPDTRRQQGYGSFDYIYQDGNQFQQAAAASPGGTVHVQHQSYPGRVTDSQGRRRQGQSQGAQRKKQNQRRQSVPNDDRITLGQSLATRLWRVLHTPVAK
ncbi:hypothetical protein SK128_027510 [Halocaridina rubra]|uniref:Lipocalin/cytosolic fatty-acid binding domain-containing protein n=1 Tax=Halocaridina rubra TaxID=373956 RepID=A0AAN9A059_HALRR